MYTLGTAKGKVSVIQDISLFLYILTSSIRHIYQEIYFNRTPHFTIQPYAKQIKAILLAISCSSKVISSLVLGVRHFGERN